MATELGNIVREPRVRLAPSEGWIADPAAEALLDRLNVEWTYLPGVPIGSIDRNASLQNQARVSAVLNPDVVSDYAVAMLDGARFPALVGFLRSNGAYILAGGNHRLAAATDAGRETVDLYVVHVTEPAMRTVITSSLNTLVGVRPTQEEILSQAINWMDRFGHNATMTARLFNVSRATLGDAVRERMATQRIARAGLDPTRISKSARKSLAVIPNDPAMIAAAALVQDARLTYDDVNALTREVREQRTEADQIRVVERWRAREDIKLRTVEAQTSRRMSGADLRRSSLLRGLGIARNVLAGGRTRAEVGLADDRLGEALAEARTVVRLLEALSDSA